MLLLHFLLTLIMHFRLTSVRFILSYDSLRRSSERFILSYDSLRHATARYQSGLMVQAYGRNHIHGYRIRSRVGRSNHVLLYWIRQVHGLR